MKVLAVTLFGALLSSVCCRNAWVTSRSDSEEIREKATKTTIVAYDKASMTEIEIENEIKRIENECNCNAKNLASVGALILSHANENHPMATDLSLDPTREIGADDEVLTIFNTTDPTDPDFGKQWALTDINIAEGWKEYLSDSQGGNASGPSVIIAVIDTGVDYTHPELADVMWTNPGETPGNGIDDDGNGIIDDVYGADFISSDTAIGDPMDDSRDGHGTHCAGIIAAKENNGVGIAGVASFTQGKVKVMACKGLDDDGKGTTSVLLSCLNYAISNGAKISSNSWGGSSVDSDKETIWDLVLRNNPEHLFVASAGNDNEFIDDDNKRMNCGLNEYNLLCVASSTQDDEKSPFSNYGPHVHVFAPGSWIYSLYPGNRYNYMSGTSMACPHVAGLAALIETMRTDLTGQQVRLIIESNVQKKTAYTDLVTSGGLIDVAATIIALKCTDIPGKYSLVKFFINKYVHNIDR